MTETQSETQSVEVSVTVSDWRTCQRFRRDPHKKPVAALVGSYCTGCTRLLTRHTSSHQWGSSRSQAGNTRREEGANCPNPSLIGSSSSPDVCPCRSCTAVMSLAEPFTVGYPVESCNLGGWLLRGEWDTRLNHPRLRVSRRLCLSRKCKFCFRGEIIIEHTAPSISCVHSIRQHAKR